MSLLFALFPAPWEPYLSELPLSSGLLYTSKNIQTAFAYAFPFELSKRAGLILSSTECRRRQKCMPSIVGSVVSATALPSMGRTLL